MIRRLGDAEIGRPAASLPWRDEMLRPMIGAIIIISLCAICFAACSRTPVQNPAASPPEAPTAEMQKPGMATKPVEANIGQTGPKVKVGGPYPGTPPPMPDGSEPPPPGSKAPVPTVDPSEPLIIPPGSNVKPPPYKELPGAPAFDTGKSYKAENSEEKKND